MLLWPISSCSSGSKREAEIRLDTDVRKCNNILSSVKLTKKGLLGVEKSYHLTYYIMFTLKGGDNYSKPNSLFFYILYY